MTKLNNVSLLKSEAISTTGMIGTKDRYATEIGKAVLDNGGNAIDAAVASCLAIGVVEPTSSGIGGGGYLNFQVGDKGGVIGFPMQASLSANSDMYSIISQQGVGSFGWASVKNDENIHGYKSIAIPGAVAGLYKAHELYGSMPWSELVEPSIKLAREGITPHWHLLFDIGKLMGLIFQYDELRRVLMPSGVMPTSDINDVNKFKQPHLADVLEQISKYGAKGFYEGDVAEALVKGIQDNGGILTTEDFAQYTPFVWDQGLEFAYRGKTVRVPPYACAGTTSAMTLKLLNNFNLSKIEHNSIEMLNAYILSARMAYVDRFEYLADPNFVDVPWEGLVSDGYIKTRFQEMSGISQYSDGKEINYRPGNPWIEEKRKPKEVLPASVPSEDKGTTHLGVIDKFGNAVSLTNTLMSGFGSGVVPKNTGVIMNNGMMWFDPIPDRVNSIKPGKFPLNNMTPALVLGDNGVEMSVGASGGRRITNCVTQLIIKCIDYGMSPQEAIDSPRIDCSAKIISTDPRIPAEVLSKLEPRGHRFQSIGDHSLDSGFPSFASPVVITKDEDGTVRGGVDSFHSAFIQGQE